MIPYYYLDQSYFAVTPYRSCGYTLITGVTDEHETMPATPTAEFTGIKNVAAYPAFNRDSSAHIYQCLV